MAETYTAESIRVLAGLEAVRMRPGMYVGDVTDGSGLHHLIWEVVGNSIDQHLARRARHLRVDVDERWVTVEDDGLGIPVDDFRGQGSVLEVVFTTLHCGATWDGHFPHVHVAGAMHGVGLAAVNALCARLEVESRHSGQLWRMAFERGRKVDPLTCCGSSRGSGTRVRFRPDPAIFSGPGFDLPRIESRLRELAWLNPLLNVRWQGEALPGRGGLAAWVRDIAGNALDCRYVFSTTRIIDEVCVDLAVGWRRSGAPDLRAYVNQCRTRSGTHVEGLWQGFAACLGGRVGPVRELLEPGMIACLHVGLYDPRFGGPSREQLATPIAERSVYEAVLAEFSKRRAPQA